MDISQLAADDVLCAKFEDAGLKHQRNNTIIVLGDSHVNFFSGNEKLAFEPIGHKINICPCINGAPFTVMHLGACLAYNVLKYDTYYHFREKYELLIKKFIKPNAMIVFSLGEIDIRTHVYKQAAIRNLSYKSVVKEIVDRYFSFLLEVKDKGFKPVCWGPIASQPDVCPINENFPRNGSEVERNKATEFFTDYMRSLCQENDILFLSVFDKMITADYHTLKEYLCEDYCHLSQRAMEIALQEWNKILISE